MYARLNAGFGWRWENEDGSLGPFVLSSAMRYAGMVSGTRPDGRVCARPLSEFDALSIDGIEWQPFAVLRELIPWEATHVQQETVHLPGEGPRNPGEDLSAALAA